MGKTSNAVKQRYNEKNYKQVKVSLKINLVEQWEKKLQEDSISKANSLETPLCNI